MAISKEKIQSLNFEEIEELSQKCSQTILFDLLDKKNTVDGSKNQIEECKIYLAEYQTRMMLKHKLDTLKPLEK